MLSEQFLLILFFTLSIAMLSGIVYILPSCPIKYIKLHLLCLTLPIVVAIIGLVTTQQRQVISLFAVDKLAWLLVSFILTLGFIIQKFSMRYLLGDHNYKNISHGLLVRQYLHLSHG